RPPPFPYTPLFRSPPASNRRFSRRTCRTVIRRAAATWAFVSRPPHSAFNSPGRCSSFRLNVKVSIEGGPFHGAVRGGHFHVAAAYIESLIDERLDSGYRRAVGEERDGNAWLAVPHATGRASTPPHGSTDVAPAPDRAASHARTNSTGEVSHAIASTVV